MKKLLLTTLILLASLSAATAQVTLLPDTTTVKPGEKTAITLRIQNTGATLVNVPLVLGVTAPGFSVVADPSYLTAGTATAYKFVDIPSGTTFTQVFYIQCTQATEPGTYNSFFVRINNVLIGQPTVQVPPSVFASINPTQLTVGSGGSTAANLSINNTASYDVEVAITDNATWLSAPSPVTVPANSVGNITVTANGSALTNGFYEGTLNVDYDNNGSEGSQFQMLFIVGTVSIPTVDPDNLTFTVVKDSTVDSQVITLGNKGNGPIDFTITSDVEPHLIGYGLNMDSKVYQWRKFFPTDSIDTNTQFIAWSSATSTDAMPIGFDFKYLGTDYTTFSVDTSGRLTLGGSEIINVFYNSGLSVTQENLRYEKKPGQLIVSWEDASIGTAFENMQFQIQLFDDGRLQFLYWVMNGATGSDGLCTFPIDDTSYTFFPDDYQIEREVVESTPYYTQLVSATPTTGTVNGGASVPVTFSIDAEAISAATYNKTFTVHWSDGTQDTIPVKVIVANESQSIGLPETVTFNGPAGALSQQTITITNTGNVATSFSFVDTTAQDNEYTWTNTFYNWQVPLGEIYVLTDSDGGISPLQEIPFDLPYFGTPHTNYAIGMKGGISLGAATPIATQTQNQGLSDGSSIPSQLIAPFWHNDIQMDANTRVYGGAGAGKVVVTWENIRISSNPDQTFQAILYPTGKIIFQYKQVGDSTFWTQTGTTSANRTVPGGIGLKDTSRVAGHSLIFEGDDGSGTVSYQEVVTYTTNSTAGSDVETITATTNMVPIYDSPLKHQAFSWTPPTTLITVTPATGSLLVGETKKLTITADARTLAAGGSVVTDYEVSPGDEPMKVTFTADAPASADLADSDGDGQTDFAELQAGTDALDANSTFSANLDGSRTINWTAPQENRLNRSYTIWFTADLSSEWEVLTTVEDVTSYVDEEHTDTPVIFYKVTVN